MTSPGRADPRFEAEIGHLQPGMSPRRASAPPRIVTVDGDTRWRRLIRQAPHRLAAGLMSR